MGYTNKDEQDIVNDILLRILDGTTEVNDANVGSVLRNYVESISEEIKVLYNSLDLVYAGTRIDTATGDDLEQLGVLVGITRNAGTDSDGNVTFERNAPASADFTIADGGVISTRPNIGSDQLRFAVNSSVVFLSSVANESHEFVDGIYNYAMAERIIGNTSEVAILATVSATSSVALTNGTDFYVIKGFNDFTVDIDTITDLETCETADWANSTDATADATSTDRLQGDYSIKLGKDGTASDGFSYSKTLASAINGIGNEMVLALKFDAEGTVNKLSNIEVTIGSGGSASNSYVFTLDPSTITKYGEWWRYKFNYNSTSVEQNGLPSISAINYVKIEFTTNNASDTITTGQILMDSWLFADTTAYEGDLIRFDKNNSVPDTATNFFVDYTPLSKEVPVTAEAVGADYNVSKNKINYKVSNIPNVTSVNNYVVMSGGTDTETDSALRTRITFASELQGKATAEAIEQAVLGVSGVASVSVEDMPLTSLTSEMHIFSSGIDTYSLAREVLKLDDNTSPTNITVTGTLSATTGHAFVYGSDYVQVLDAFDAPTSEVEFQAGGDEPDDGSSFNIDYQVNLLGHVNVFVSGVENPLPSDVSASVTEAVDDTKAAGITVAITTPTVIPVAVTAEIVPDTENGYSYAAIEQSISDSIYNLLNTKPIAEDVFLSEIIQAIMNTTGVDNCDVTLPATDTVIDTDEIARPGTITLTEA